MKRVYRVVEVKEGSNTYYYSQLRFMGLWWYISNGLGISLFRNNAYQTLSYYSSALDRIKEFNSDINKEEELRKKKSKKYFIIYSEGL